MRALWIAVAFLVLGLTFAYADQVYSVEMSGTYTATVPCTSNCTETLSASFQFILDPTWSLPCPTSPYSACRTNIVPGTFSLTSDGFMGTFTSSGVIAADNYIPTFDTLGLNTLTDEIDIEGFFPYGGDSYSVPVPKFNIFHCGSDACRAAFANTREDGYLMYPQQWWTVVKAPEPSSLALLVVPAVVFLRKCLTLFVGR